MEKYKNLGRDSGVIAFETNLDSIIVAFKDGSQYLYNHSKPGKSYVDQMKKLASKGHGLNSLISRVIRKNYYTKLN